MSAALDSIPLLAGVGTVCSAVGGAVGAWAKGRSVERASVAASHAKEHAATEETERAALAHDVALVPELMAELRALREEARRDREHAAVEREKCRAENEAMRRELDTVLDALADLRGRHERQGEQLRVVSAELARWRGSIPAGAD